LGWAKGEIAIDVVLVVSFAFHATATAGRNNHQVKRHNRKGIAIQGESARVPIMQTLPEISRLNPLEMQVLVGKCPACSEFDSLGKGASVISIHPVNRSLFTFLGGVQAMRVILLNKIYYLVIFSDYK